jgi:hypothetical protein
VNCGQPVTRAGTCASMPLRSMCKRGRGKRPSTSLKHILICPKITLERGYGWAHSKELQGCFENQLAGAIPLAAERRPPLGDGHDGATAMRRWGRVHWVDLPCGHKVYSAKTTFERCGARITSRYQKRWHDRKNVKFFIMNMPPAISAGTRLRLYARLQRLEIPYAASHLFL